MEAPTNAKADLKYLAEASGVFETMSGMSFKKVKGNNLFVSVTAVAMYHTVWM